MDVTVAFATSSKVITTVTPNTVTARRMIAEVETMASAIHGVDPLTSTATMLSAASETDPTEATKGLAMALGYVVGLGSLLLYTPIAVRLWRQQSAAGLADSTWWLKLSSYTCNDVYSYTKGYPLSTYVETLIITAEAAIILGLVSYYQKTWQKPEFALGILLYCLVTFWGLTWAPDSVLAAAQFGAAALNTAALVPQFLLNYQGQTKGDYSPTTAALASTGCLIRVFTVTQLADSDPILLFSFGLALVLNTLLLLQIIYYGVFKEGLSLGAVFAADLGSHRSLAASDEQHILK